MMQNTISIKSLDISLVETPSANNDQRAVCRAAIELMDDRRFSTIADAQQTGEISAIETASTKAKLAALKMARDYHVSSQANNSDCEPSPFSLKLSPQPEFVQKLVAEG